MQKTLGSRECKTRLGSDLQQVQAGVSIVGTHCGQPLVELRPVPGLPLNNLPYFTDPKGSQALTRREKEFLVCYFGRSFDVDRITVRTGIGSRAYSLYGNTVRLPARFFQSGAVMSLSRLWQKAKKQARKMLADIYGWFKDLTRRICKRPGCCC